LTINVGKDPALPSKTSSSSYSYYKHYVYTSAVGKGLWKDSSNPNVFAALTQISGSEAIHKLSE